MKDANTDGDNEVRPDFEKGVAEMINSVTLVGRLTRDLELKYTNSNIAFVRFTVAVNRHFSNQNGERQADFIGCVAWRVQAENMAKFLKKGSLIGLTGRIETGRFMTQDGQERFTTDVIADNVQFLEPRGTAPSTMTDFSSSDTRAFSLNHSGGPAFQTGQANTNQSTPFPSMNNDSNATIDISDDDLPF